MTRRIVLPALLTLAVCTLAVWTLAVSAHAQDREGTGTVHSPRGGPVPDLSGVDSSGFILTEFQRIVRGFPIAPVPLDLQDKDLALVGLG